MSVRRTLFISGWGVDSSIWDAVAGKIDTPKMFLPWWECLKDNTKSNSLLKLLENIDQPVVLVGWSLGGMIALSVACAFPEKIAGLVLVSSSARMVADDGYEGTNPRVLRAMKIRLKTDKSGMLKDFADLASYPTEDAERYKSFMNTAKSIDNDKLSKGLSYLQQFDMRRELENIRIPIRIIHGKDDRIMNVSNAHYLAKNLPDATLEVVPQSGHFVVQDRSVMISNKILELGQLLSQSDYVW